MHRSLRAKPSATLRSRIVKASPINALEGLGNLYCGGRSSGEKGWTTRALERQINTLYYERLLATSDRPAVEQEASSAIAPLQSPRDFVRDPVILEFLGFPGVGRLLEAGIERTLLDNLQAFLLELGRGFAFVGRQYRLSTET